MSDARRQVEAVWRIEGARIVASVAKMTGDFGLAEDVSQEAVAEALQSWPAGGIPLNPGAWLTAVAKRRAIDAWRRTERRDERYAQIAQALETTSGWQPIGDDVLRLVFTACHPVLAREAQIALTLRVVAGLSTEEIARMLLVSVAAVQARITRAKKTLAAARVPFEAPDPAEWKPRLVTVLGVVYLLFTEGYAATAGERWTRPDLADEALRLGRVVAALLPAEPVLLYEALGRIAPNPIVELNRAVAVSMVAGPASALELVDALEDSGQLRDSYLLPSVRGELLLQLGKLKEAQAQLLLAASLVPNAAQRAVLEQKAAKINP